MGDGTLPAGHVEVPGERSEPPQGPGEPVSGVPEPTGAPQAPIDALRAALRLRYAEAMLDHNYAPEEITERATYGGRVFPAVDRILAVRDDELAALEVRALVAERKLLIAEERLAREADAHGHDLVRTVQAEARLRDARATITRIDALHQPRWATEVTLCPTHMAEASKRIIRPGESKACGECTDKPIQACSDIRCCTWPCAVHLALHDETEDTCTHRAAEPAEHTGGGDGR